MHEPTPNTVDSHVPIVLHSRASQLRLGFCLSCEVSGEEVFLYLCQTKISSLSASLLVPEFLPSALYSKGQSTVPCAHENSPEVWELHSKKKQSFRIRQNVSWLLQPPSSLWASVSLLVNGYDIFIS